MRKEDFDNLTNNFKNKPHIVILGAGASKACILNGDKNGRKLSVMDGFIKELGLTDLFSKVKLVTQSDNLEDVYSELSERDDCKEIVVQLETAIINYFSKLELPSEPTIYDYLLLSLREKDVVATFNWDNLLLQAYRRISRITKDRPQLAFLHGNVGVGYCPNDHERGSMGNPCTQCGELYIPSKLLYPIKKKNYSTSLQIAQQWEGLKQYINNAGMITIFGYGAPQTDVEAKQLLYNAFNCFNGDKRFLETLEIIDKPGADHSELRDKWSDFIDLTNDHCEIRNSFFDSYLAKFPRRSIEGYCKSQIEGWWGKASISFKNDLKSIDEIENLIRPLLTAEKKNNFEII